MTRLGSTAGWRVLAAATVACSLVLAGCDTTPKDETSGKATEKLYEEARDEAANGNWERASKLYEKLEGRAAGTALAQQAQIDLAYAYYKTGEKALAIATLERFIRLHPSSPALDYAYYLQGLVNFNERLGLLSSFARQDLSERDQQASRDAYQSFRQLTTQFPDSKYAPDASVRVNYITNTLAVYEVHVARYYYNRSAYVAAANRAQQAVAEFQYAPATEEALFLMVRSYDKLGLIPLRDDAERVLQKNFPNSVFLSDATGGRKKSWWRFW